MLGHLFWKGRGRGDPDYGASSLINEAAWWLSWGGSVETVGDVRRVSDGGDEVVDSAVPLTGETWCVETFGGAFRGGFFGCFSEDSAGFEVGCRVKRNGAEAVTKNMYKKTENT